MAAKSKYLYDYVAHIRSERGKITELAGTREDYSLQKVYQWLLQKAGELDGWLYTQHITPADETVPAEDEVKTEKPKVVRTSQEPPIFDNIMMFGKYTKKAYIIKKWPQKEK